MSQPDCKLCGKSADKTNSHILPFSLIKEAVSLDGSKGRDKEAVFSISSNKSMKLYTGRGVLPEKKEKVKEDSDNIEESEVNTTTEDYIFCEDCEKKFGVIESYFSRLVIDPFKRTGIFFSKGELVQVDDKLEGLIIRIYVLGLVWRCSVSTIHPFKLDKILESELKKILFLSMSTELNELKDNAIKYKDEIYKYPVIAFYGESLVDQTGSIVFSTSDLSNASFVFANRFCFMIYNSSNVDEDLSNDIIGFSKYISSHDCLNYEAGKFKFVFVNRQQWEESIRKYMDLLADARRKYYARTFSNMYREIVGTHPSEVLVKNVVDELSSHGANISKEMEKNIYMNHILPYVSPSRILSILRDIGRL